MIALKLQEYSLKNIEQAYKAETDFKARERMQITLHLREGYTEREVCAMMRVSTGKVPFWKQRFGELCIIQKMMGKVLFESQGFEGLYGPEGRGHKGRNNSKRIT